MSVTKAKNVRSSVGRDLALSATHVTSAGLGHCEGIAQTGREAHQAAREAVHITSPRGTLADVIARAQSGDKMETPPGEDIAIDPEPYQRAVSATPFEKP
ncbi:hypothetical protein ACEWPM_012000 [Roseovarius sp. S4756]|uniref:hypothetical protein n=1 Tax=Roseovarius maritimus TaxID=3342637 RepID=UPI00372B8333